MRKDRQKLLIPCYRDMDPYDMPESLSVLQSYDMSKIGFIQDLIRGIQKVIDKESNTNSQQFINGDKESNSTNLKFTSNTSSLVERAYMLLEDREFNKANDIAEMILNDNPKDAEAYVIKLLAKRDVASLDALSQMPVDLSSDNSFARALKFASAELREQLEFVKTECDKRFKAKKNKTKKRRILIASFAMVICLGGCFCYYFWPEIQNEIVYISAQKYVKEEAYDEAINLYSQLENYKDAEIQLKETENLKKYKEGCLAYEKEDYQKAYQYLAELDDYKDSRKLSQEIAYTYAKQLMDIEEYEEAIAYFNFAKGYEDTEEQLQESKYLLVSNAFERDEYTDIACEYAAELAAINYKDSTEYNEVMNCSDIIGEIKVNPSGAEIKNGVSQSREIICSYTVTDMPSEYKGFMTTRYECIYYDSEESLNNGNGSILNEGTIGVKLNVACNMRSKLLKTNKNGRIVLNVYDDKGKLIFSKTKIGVT